MNYFDPYPLAADKSIVMAWDSEVARAAQTPWLAEALARAGSDLFPRFADCYAQLRALPRGARRALQRQLARSQELAAILPEWLHGEAGHALQQKLARTLAGAALLLALGQGVAQANIINVTPKTPPGIILGDGKCSLAEAIIAANTDAPFDACPAGSGPDTIVLSKGTQTLTSYVPSIYSPTGLPLINSNITIEGNGAKITRKKTAAQFRLMAVQYTGTLTLNNLTLSGGNSTYGGGGVFNGGYLTVNNCIITGNKAFGGGAISNYGGYSQINNSTISKNTASYGGGGIFNRSFAPGYRGDVVLNNSTITGNKANDGGGIYSAGGVYADISINNSTISKNTASRFGGGIENDFGATYVNNSVVTGNKSGNDGGGIFNLYNTAVLVVYNGSILSKNSAGDDGGGIANIFGYTGVFNSTITGNKARGEDGGGIYSFGSSAVLVVQSSTLSKNSAPDFGGGIANIFGYNGVFNSTITGNKAGRSGGGIYNYFATGFANVGNTFSQNKAPNGPDVYSYP